MHLKTKVNSTGQVEGSDGGDIDKLARAALDSLVTGGCLLDDSQVVQLHARKVWVMTDGFWLSIPGVQITVREVRA